MVLSIVSLHAQRIITDVAKEGTLKNGDYLKAENFDNIIEKYSGTWEWSQGKDTFVLEIRCYKKLYMQFGDSHYYGDFVFGWYKYIKNGKLIENFIPVTYKMPGKYQEVERHPLIGIQYENDDNYLKFAYDNFRKRQSKTKNIQQSDNIVNAIQGRVSGSNVYTISSQVNEVGDVQIQLLDGIPKTLQWIIYNKSSKAPALQEDFTIPISMVLKKIK